MDSKLNLPLTHGDAHHEVHWTLSIFDSDEQRYVPATAARQLVALEVVVVLLNVVNVAIYLAEWSGVTTASVIIIFWSRFVMLGCTIGLGRDGNFNAALFRRQFSEKNHNRWANIGIVVNLFVCAIVRLWIQFLEDGQPYGAKTVWYVFYQASYLLPYGYFLLLDALRKSSHAFRIFVSPVGVLPKAPRPAFTPRACRSSPCRSAASSWTGATTPRSAATT